ncbi:MAG: hypothetical protein ACR2NH_06455 [Solirubrobacteraceae bacterium]
MALAVDLVLLLGARRTLLSSDLRLADFFEVQARALLAGHLSVAPESVGFEGFEVDAAEQGLLTRLGTTRTSA